MLSSLCSGCDIKFDWGGAASLVFLKQNVSSVRECATVSANTDGGVYWTYRTSKIGNCNCNCVVKNSAEGHEFSNAGRISGGRECGEMSQEKWDQMIFESCDRKYDRGVKDYRSSTAAENIENEQTCAELAVSKPSTSFWVYKQSTGHCYFKKS